MDIWDVVNRALDARRNGLDSEHRAGLRLFNGYYEGYPELVVDLYGRTLLLSASGVNIPLLDLLQSRLLARLPWVECVVQKIRSAQDALLRRGRVTFGGAPAKQVFEQGIWYALDLTLNQDASFYLDTRGLRQWLLQHMAGASVLNTFAYTGSLGVAALAGGAVRVVQLDRNARFLAFSRQSCSLNALDPNKVELQVGDFFPAVARLKRSGGLFDCVIADPPFFSSTPGGTVNLVDEGMRIINKLRPLVRDGGRLITINNALFLSGAEHMRLLEALCADGYLEIETLIPVPEDITGFADTIVAHPPVDPAPFNHPTKITILKVRRKTA